MIGSKTRFSLLIGANGAGAGAGRVGAGGACGQGCQGAGGQGGAGVGAAAAAGAPTVSAAATAAATEAVTETVTIVDENGEEVELELGADGMPLASTRFVPQTPDQGMTPRERIEDLLARMRPCRDTLLEILRMCAEPTPAAEVSEAVDQMQRFSVTAFGSHELCNLLRRAGGIELVCADGTPYPEGEQQPRRVAAEGAGDEKGAGDARDEKGDGAGSAGGAQVAEGADRVDGARDVEVAQGADAAGPVQGADAADGAARAGESPERPEALEAGEPLVAYWRTTPDGLAVAEADDPLARLNDLFENDALYRPIYKCILTLCAREGGAKTPALGAAVNGHDLVQHPRLFVTYFIDRLEKAGALAWTGSWVATPAGVEGIGLLGDAEDIEVAPNVDDARAPEPSFLDELGLLEG